MSIINYPRKAEYQLGGLYLVRKSCFVHQIEILAVTKKAYRIRWESGNTSWVTIEDFNFEYSFLEHLNEKK